MPVQIEEKFIAELRRISILLALNMTKGQSQREKIEILAGVGFQPKEIAEILGTTAGTVSVTLTRSRKDRRGEQRNEEEADHENSALA